MCKTTTFFHYITKTSTGLIILRHNPYKHMNQNKTKNLENFITWYNEHGTIDKRNIIEMDKPPEKPNRLNQIIQKLRKKSRTT